MQDSFFTTSFLKRCSPANSSVTSHNIQQTWEAVFWNCSLWPEVKRQAYDLWVNGVPKLASAVISPTKRKTWAAIFIWLFLLLDAEKLFHNLLNGVPEVASTEISRNFTKIWEAIFVNSFLFLEADRFCHSQSNQLWRDFFRNKFSMFAMFFS